MQGLSNLLLGSYFAISGIFFTTIPLIQKVIKINRTQKKRKNAVSCFMVTYEALSCWGSGKVFLDIIFKIQEYLIEMISNAIEMLFIVYNKTFLQKQCVFPHVTFLHWFMVLFSCLINVIFSHILMENFVLFSNARSILEIMLCN